MKAKLRISKTEVEEKKQKVDVKKALDNYLPFYNIPPRFKDLNEVTHQQIQKVLPQQEQ